MQRWVHRPINERLAILEIDQIVLYFVACGWLFLQQIGLRCVLAVYAVVS